MRSTHTELARQLLVNRGRLKLADLGEDGLGTVANTLMVRDLLSLRTTSKNFRTMRPHDWLNDWLKSHRDWKPNADQKKSIRAWFSLPMKSVSLAKRVTPDQLNDDTVVSIAATVGCVALLQRAMESGIRPTAGTGETAARHGDLDVLKWGYDGNGVGIGCATCASAAGGGHLHVLQWLTEEIGACDATTCASAALGGHLDVLTWAHENGYPWDETTCSSAALGGHLKVLEWARKHGCPWDEKTCSSAALGGHLDVLKWARKHGCPWDWNTFSSAALSEHHDVMQWAIENGCPPPPPDSP
jgi:hypothetical protein